MSREIKSILNKLTPEKFDTLMKQVLDISIDTQDQLEEIINIIFEKVRQKN